AKLDDLVLNRRAIARADAFDLAGIHRGLADVLLNDAMRRRRGPGNATLDLRRGDAVGHEGERYRILVRPLPPDGTPVNRSPVQSCRRTSLQSAKRNA